ASPDSPNADMDAMDQMMQGGMKSGGDTDRIFLQMMIPDHQLAVDVAEDALRHAEHHELKGLAQEIVQGRSAEITEMEGYLLDWYGASLMPDEVEHEAAQMNAGSRSRVRVDYLLSVTTLLFSS